MALNTTIDDKYYKSDSLEKGRIARDFFEQLTNTIFKKSYRHFEAYKEITDDNWLPIAYGEKKAYSTVAAAIDKITPIHQSEYPFSGWHGEHDETDNKKRIDFCCLHKRKKDQRNKSINYFIELKHAFYHLIDSQKSSENGFRASGKKSINSMIEQLNNLKKSNPDIHGFNNIYMGLAIIRGIYNDKGNQEEHRTKEDVLKTVHDMIDEGSRSQLLMNTWMLPKEMDGLPDQGNSPVKFIAIVGIIKSTDKK